MERQWLPSNFSEAPWLKRSMVELGSLTAVPLSGLPRLSAASCLPCSPPQASRRYRPWLEDWCIDRDRGVAERSPGKPREAQIGTTAKQPGHRPRPDSGVLDPAPCLQAASAHHGARRRRSHDPVLRRRARSVTPPLQMASARPALLRFQSGHRRLKECKVISGGQLKRTGTIHAPAPADV
jgi:hypothetical protein